MRITTLNQIFGILAATATWCVAEARPLCGHYPYPPSH
jgi:hypothetical protein